MTLAEQQHTAQTWFRELRDTICEEFEQIELAYTTNNPSISENRRDRAAAPASEGESRSEREQRDALPVSEANHATTFSRTSWVRPEGGGGEISLMKGRVFEKVGVNISTVHGEFSPQFRSEIPGAESDPRFWATGISLVAHPANPHVPAAHMNTRMIVVGAGNSLSPRERAGGEGAPTPAALNPNTANRLWFGGGGDLNPAIPYDEDTAAFHTAFQRACDATQPDFYPAFSGWCDEYFHLPHRNMARGVGGIFYDYLGLARLGADTAPVTSGRFGKGGANGPKTVHGMDVANHAPLDWDEAFTFTQTIGTTFRDTYSALVRARMATHFTPAERQQQLVYRGRYAEYNLLYDRGTRFGLMTGGNPDAILMSLPPLAVWE